jgi:photosystem II stability/assembly factor-like uncharacterized protein
MSALTWRFVGAWTGGTVQDVALSPDFGRDATALAATRAGLFRSTDGGATWSRARGIAFQAATATAFAPGDARVALAALRDGVLFRSADGGATWRPVEGWAFGPIIALALSPDFPAHPALFAAAGDGIYRSLDGGANWQSANFGLLEPEVLCLSLAFDFATSELGWAGSAAGGLYRTRNAGRAWREAGDGLADSAVQCLAHGKGWLYAGTEGAGIFRSADGVSWESCGLAGMQVNCVVARGGRVLAGTGEGIFHCHEGSDEWQAAGVADGLADGVIALAMSVDGGVALAGCLDAGILRSADGGRTWHPANAGLYARTPPAAVLAPDGAVFALDESGSAAHSPDGGPTWLPCPISADEGPLESLAAGGSPRAPQVIASTARSVLGWQTARGSFEPLAVQPALAGDDVYRALHVTPRGDVFIGTRAGAAFASIDGGTTWHPIDVPGQGALGALRLTTAGGLYALRLAPAASGSYAAEAWHLPALSLPMRKDEPWQLAMALDALRLPLACLEIVTTPSSERVLLAGQNAIAIGAPMEDSGFMAAKMSLPARTVITALARHGPRLMAGTNDGTFASIDGGATWQPSDGALDGVPVVAALADARGFCAVTLGGEVWRSP